MHIPLYSSDYSESETDRTDRKDLKERQRARELFCILITFTNVGSASNRLRVILNTEELKGWTVHSTLSIFGTFVVVGISHTWIFLLVTNFIFIQPFVFSVILPLSSSPNVCLNYEWLGTVRSQTVFMSWTQILVHKSSSSKLVEEGRRKLDG